MKIANIYSVLIILSLVLLFYWDSAQTFFFGEILTDLEFNLTHPARFMRCFTFAAYGFLYDFFGFNPLPFNMLNISLHFLNSVLLFYVITHFTQNRIIGLTSASLFGTFWLCSEVVPWSSATNEIMWSFFALLSVIFFECYIRKSSLLYYVLSLFTFILAVGSKESAVVLPLVFFLISRWHRPIGFNLRSMKTLFPGEFLLYMPFVFVACFETYMIANMMAVGESGGGPVFEPSRAIEGFCWNLKNAFSIFPPISHHTRSNGWQVLFLVLALLCLRPSTRYNNHIIMLLRVVAVLLLPHIFSGFSQRHLYAVPLASMAVVAIAVYELSQLVGGLIERVLHVQKHEYLTIAVNSFFVGCLVLLWYPTVKNSIDYNKRCGKVVESFGETLTEALPNGTEQHRLILINVPSAINPSNPPVELKLLLGNAALGSFLFFHLMDKDYKVIQFKLALNLPKFMYYQKEGSRGRFLRFETKYPIAETEEVTSSYFDEISVETRNKVFIFNPYTERIEDVTGLTYRELRNRLLAGGFHHN